MIEQTHFRSELPSATPRGFSPWQLTICEKFKYCLRVRVHMVTKTITVTKDAYMAIKNRKQSDESFSQLFLRIGHKSPSITEFVGLLNSESGERLSKEIKKSRKRFDKEMEKRHHVLFG